MKALVPGLLILTGILIWAQPIIAQQPALPVKDSFTTVVAGIQYLKSPNFQKNWGVHYRKEWATPVLVKVVFLDTLEGGLVPYEAGGGRQTKNLRLRDANGKEYVLRSIEKTFGKALPDIYRGTFLETIIDDQASIGHPYASITIPPMAEAAKIYHTRPQIIYVPEQKGLDSFNKEYANRLYLFEKRPDENWDTAENFGFSKKIIGTEDLLEKLKEDNANYVDQHLYVRSRLFDIFIGDWSRHEDQWRWASFPDENGVLYKPIPRDRDQAYTLFDGKLLGFGISVAGLKHLQSFDSTVADITRYNFSARNLDRRMTNEVTREDWLKIARELQLAITDRIIEEAILRLPPEVYPISGSVIINKLKARRNDLTEYASRYYEFLAKDVDIPGTEKKEVFIVSRIDNNKTKVEVFKMNTSESAHRKIIYERIFNNDETEEIRLYGEGEDDIFQVKGNVDQSILVRIVGGKGNDLVTDSSSVKGSKKMTRVYDSEKSHVYGNGESKVYISKDSVINNYQYSAFDYDDLGFRLTPGLVSLTFGYGLKAEEWRKDPVGEDHSVKIKYAINRQAINIDYRTIFYQAIGRWNLAFGLGVGIPSVVNFFGIGNESDFSSYDRHFFRLRSRDYYGKAGINRVFGNNHLLNFAGFYQSVKIIADEERFITSFAHNNNGNSDFERQHFTGVEASYKYRKTDNPIIPSRGINFTAGSSYTYNISEPDHSFTRLNSEASVYIPLLKFVSLGVRVGGAANIGDAEFYQLNILGSHENLRGYRKQRFYGKQSFYNNNELRFAFDTKSRLFNGKMGFIFFYDTGRVWHPNENSNAWHAGYGMGVFLAPFNKIILAGNYGISREDQVLTAHVGFYF